MTRSLPPSPVAGLPVLLPVLLSVLLPVLLGACAVGDLPPMPEPAAARTEVSADAVVTPAPTGDRHGSAGLPVPVGLQPQVDFWRNVYANWGLGQAALHDDRYLNLVYRVLRLPGRVTDDYTPAQRAYVRREREALAIRLRRLERKLARGDGLSRDEQKLATLIRTRVGEHALQGAAERVRGQRGLRQRFRRGLEISGRYLPRFEAIFREAGLPVDLALLPHVESSFQAHARSSAGAAGMWQFTRSTGRHFLRVNGAIDERLDPVAAAAGAARLLADNYRRLKSWPHAVTAYNYGVGGMYRARQRYGDDFTRVVYQFDGRRFGFAARNFYAEFLAAREIARNATAYFPGLQPEPPLALDYLLLEQDTTAAALGFRYRVSLERLAELNPSWRREVLNGRRRLPRGVRVWLPAGALERAGGDGRRPAAADET